MSINILVHLIDVAAEFATGNAIRDHGAPPRFPRDPFHDMLSVNRCAHFYAGNKLREVLQ